MLSSSPPIVCVPFELGRPETVGPVTEKFGSCPIKPGPLLGFEFEKVTAESSPEWGSKLVCRSLLLPCRSGRAFSSVLVIRVC